MNRNKLWCACGMWGALGCGGDAVDLGRRDASGFADVPSATAEPLQPQTVYESRVHIYGFTADDATLYALLDSSSEPGQLVSCPIDRCRSERTVLAARITPANMASLDTPLLMAGDWLCWLYGAGTPRKGIAACPKTGCDSPERTETALFGELATDGQYVYWVDTEGGLMRWKPGGPPAERLATLSQSHILRVAVNADYVYYGSPELISRHRKDGTGASELVAHVDHVSSLAVSDDALYYVSQILAGSVVQCPLGNCEGSARILSSNQRWPSFVYLAAPELFWINHIAHDEGGDPAQGALLSCQLPDCAQTRTWRSGFDLPAGGHDFVTLSSGFAITSRFVWWLEGAQGWGAALRRLPR